MVRSLIALTAAAFAVTLSGSAFAGSSLKSAGTPVVSREHGVTVFRATPHAWRTEPVFAKTTSCTCATVRVMRLVRADYLAVDTRPRGDRLGKFRFYGNF